jgi:hypothetical protein
VRWGWQSFSPQKETNSAIYSRRSNAALLASGGDAQHRAAAQYEAKLQLYEAELAEAERRFLARPSRAEDEALIADLSGRVAQLEYANVFGCLFQERCAIPSVSPNSL